ncbi:hypothetical protein A0J61_06492, partial [Choanephora cucurbitarum]
WTLFVVLYFSYSAQANTEKLILSVEQTPPSLPPCQHQNIPVLTPPYTQLKDSIVPSRNHSVYRLDVQPNSQYEIRISYPAITPADFQLKTIERCQHTNHISYLLEVSANYTGVSRVKDVELTPVEFHLETLYLGFLFYQVYKIVIAMVAVLCLGQFVLLPYLKEKITQVAQQKME